MAAGNRFLQFSSLRRVPEGSRSDSGGSGDSPGSDFANFFHKALQHFGPDSYRILQYFFDGCVGILSGFVRFRQVSPGSTSNLSNPLCGVPLGYGDLAQRFKFAVPQRGAGVVLNGSVKSPVPEGFPFLTFPAASARPPTLSSEPCLALFFQFFCFFCYAKKR